MKTDFIVFLCLIFFIWRGASRGFFRSLIGPISFIAATAVALFYYKSTKNIPVSISIGLFGPVVLNWLGTNIFRSFSDNTQKPSMFSCLLGALITSIWGMFIILPVVFILTLVPPFHPSIVPIIKDVKQSHTLALVTPFVKYFGIPALPTTMTSGTSTASTSNAPAPSMEAIAQTPQMQEIINDPQIMTAIEKKDYGALLSNPKIMAMAQDPEFVKKILGAYGQLQQTQKQ